MAIYSRVWSCVEVLTLLSRLCNYPGGGFRHITRSELEKRYHFVDTFPATAPPALIGRKRASRVR
jgi:hypothetical protein